MTERPLPVAEKSKHDAEAIQERHRRLVAHSEARGGEVDDVEQGVGKHAHRAEAREFARAHRRRAAGAPLSSRTKYGGRSMLRRCTRARYSPMMPSANSCTPEKIAMTEARKGKPGTPPSLVRYTAMTYTRTPKPKSEKQKPSTAASRSGSVVKPVTMLSACMTSLRSV